MTETIFGKERKFLDLCAALFFASQNTTQYNNPSIQQQQNTNRPYRHHGDSFPGLHQSRNRRRRFDGVLPRLWNCRAPRGQQELDAAGLGPTGGRDQELPIPAVQLGMDLLGHVAAVHRFAVGDTGDGNEETGMVGTDSSNEPRRNRPDALSRAAIQGAEYIRIRECLSMQT